ncbi:MAG: transporter substrate-binding domain-containing protein [Sneathiella sp.]
MKTLSLLSMCFAALFTTSVAAETVVLANGDDYTPFTDRKLKRGGMASELVEEAFKAAGWTVKYEWLPWKRGYEMAKSGKIDGAIPWTQRPDRLPHFLFSDAIVSMKEQVWARADSTATSYEDLKGKTGCLPAGYGPPAELKPLFESGAVKRDTPRGMTLCFKKLLAKRVDFIVVNSVQAASIVKSSVDDAASVKAIISADAETKLHVLVGKDHPKGAAIIAAFNKGLAALKSSGDYEKIVSSH